MLGCAVDVLQSCGTRDMQPGQSSRASGIHANTGGVRAQLAGLHSMNGSYALHRTPTATSYKARISIWIRIRWAALRCHRACSAASLQANVPCMVLVRMQVCPTAQ